MFGKFLSVANDSVSILEELDNWSVENKRCDSEYF